MSTPERLFIKRLHGAGGMLLEEELRTCMVEALGGAHGDKAVHTATPRPDDIAYVLEHVSEGWLVEFLRDLKRRAPERAIAVASALQEPKIGDEP